MKRRKALAMVVAVVGVEGCRVVSRFLRRACMGIDCVAFFGDSQGYGRIACTSARDSRRRPSSRGMDEDLGRTSASPVASGFRLPGTCFDLIRELIKHEPFCYITVPRSYRKKLHSSTSKYVVPEQCMDFGCVGETNKF